MPTRDMAKKRRSQRAWVERMRLRDPEEYRARKERHRQSSRERLAAVLSEWRKAGCLLCGERDPASLDAHHLDPTTKDGNVGDLMRSGVGVAKLKAELEKCICLCDLCHTLVHHAMDRECRRTDSNRS